MKIREKLVLLNLLLLIMLSGCAHETLISSSGQRDIWVDTPPQPANGKYYFVGRSLAVNVLDEKNGINQAVTDAIYQIAREAGTDLDALAKIRDERTGEIIRGQETTTQSATEEILAKTHEMITGSHQEGIYWERWAVRESFLGREFKRYKYYVKVSLTEKEFDDLKVFVQKKKILN